MKKLQSLLIMILLLGSYELKPIMTTTDFLGLWLALSYVSRVAHRWIDAQKISKNQMTAEDIKKIMLILQHNQYDIQYCKKNEKELLKRIDDIAKKIRDEKNTNDITMEFIRI